MLGSDPLSSRVGKALSEAVGPGLKAAFSREAVGPVGPGDKVLVEGLSGLRSGRVFFISCAPWDDNPEGPAAQVRVCVFVCVCVYVCVGVCVCVCVPNSLEILQVAK